VLISDRLNNNTSDIFLNEKISVQDFTRINPLGVKCKSHCYSVNNSGLDEFVTPMIQSANFSMESLKEIVEYADQLNAA
jgi:hypothetical protein